MFPRRVFTYTVNYSQQLRPIRKREFIGAAIVLSNWAKETIRHISLKHRPGRQYRKAVRQARSWQTIPTRSPPLAIARPLLACLLASMFAGRPNEADEERGNSVMTQLSSFQPLLSRLPIPSRPVLSSSRHYAADALPLPSACKGNHPTTIPQSSSSCPRLDPSLAVAATTTITYATSPYLSRRQPCRLSRDTEDSFVPHSSHRQAGTRERFLRRRGTTRHVVPLRRRETNVQS